MAICVTSDRMYIILIQYNCQLISYIITLKIKRTDQLCYSVLKKKDMPGKQKANHQVK